LVDTLLQNPWLDAPIVTAPSPADILPARLNHLSGPADRSSVVAVEISQLSDDVLADPLARHIQGVLFVQVLL
jgi:hypothetical protein